MVLMVRFVFVDVIVLFAHLSLTSPLPGRCIWPHDSPTLDAVVAAGLYSKPSGVAMDRTKCAFCEVHIQKWKPTDDPAYEHYRMKPSCVFVAQLVAQGLVDTSGRSSGQPTDLPAAGTPPPAATTQTSASDLSAVASAPATGDTTPRPVPPTTPTITPLQRENVELQQKIEALQHAIAREHEETANLEVKKKMELQMLTRLRTENKGKQLSATAWGFLRSRFGLLVL
jgi:Inhibitor of Apoptosis domain